ncbi:MAG TPA: hypothetical protein VHP83_17730 [Aggregatilineaceae bacterium]|nr:hypothetical protein [Aggregatilineaceae bacterium]
MYLRQRFFLIGFSMLALAVLFMAVGLPYDQFSWVDAVSDYGISDAPTPLPLEPVTEAEPGTTPPVLIEASAEEIADALPVGGVLFAPEVANAQIGISEVAEQALSAYDFVLFVDGRSSAEPFKSPLAACLRDPGAGVGLIFLAADQAPRIPVRMPSYSEFRGEQRYLCTAIDRPGTLVLIAE